jgi:hypothetical protein
MGERVKYKPPLQSYLYVSAKSCAGDIVKKWVPGFRSVLGVQTIVALNDRTQRLREDDLGMPPMQEQDVMVEENKKDIPVLPCNVFFAKHIAECPHCRAIDWLKAWPEFQKLHGPGFARANKRFLFITGLVCRRLRALMMHNFACLNQSILEGIDDPNLQDDVMEELERRARARVRPLSAFRSNQQNSSSSK